MKFPCVVLFLLALALPAFAAETKIIPGSTANPGAADHMYLQTNGNLLAPAQVCYTTDGNGNIIPISGGGGGGGSLNLINPNGQVNDVSTVGNGSATVISAPANAIGLIIEASSSNTQNLRYGIGTTPTTSSGMRLEPGRDSGYLPVGHSVSVIAEAGSNQEVSVQWIMNQ